MKKTYLALTPGSVISVDGNLYLTTEPGVFKKIYPRKLGIPTPAAFLVDVGEPTVLFEIDIRRFLESDIPELYEKAVNPPVLDRMTLAALGQILQRNGLKIVIPGSEVKTGYIRPGVEAMVYVDVPGHPTRWVSFYSFPEGGNYNKAEQTNVQFQRGYALNAGGPAGWPFSADGVSKGNPADDTGNPWVSYGSVREQEDLYQEQDARQRDQMRRAEAEATRLASTPQRSLQVRSRRRDAEGSRVEPKKRTKREGIGHREETSLSSVLSSCLQEREGNIIDGGVKVISDTHFRTSYDTLLDVWKGLGGSYTALDRETRRGEIEIVSASPGFGKRGLYEDRNMKTLEFVIHRNVRL